MSRIIELNRCQHCGQPVKKTEKICPECGRLLREKLQEINWTELLEAEPECEPAPCGPEVRALFDMVAEEYEYGCDSIYGLQHIVKKQLK